MILRTARLARRDECERPLAAGLLEHCAHAGAALVADVAERRCLEDDRQAIAGPACEHAWQLVDVVAGDELRRVLANRRDRPVEALHPSLLAGPDEGAQEP